MTDGEWSEKRDDRIAFILLDHPSGLLEGYRLQRILNRDKPGICLTLSKPQLIEHGKPRMLIVEVTAAFPRLDVTGARRMGVLARFVSEQAHRKQIEGMDSFVSSQSAANTVNNDQLWRPDQVVFVLHEITPKWLCGFGQLPTDMLWRVHTFDFGRFGRFLDHLESTRWEFFHPVRGHGLKLSNRILQSEIDPGTTFSLMRTPDVRLMAAEGVDSVFSDMIQSAKSEAQARRSIREFAAGLRSAIRLRKGKKEKPLPRKRVVYHLQSDLHRWEQQARNDVEPQSASLQGYLSLISDPDVVNTTGTEFRVVDDVTKSLPWKARRLARRHVEYHRFPRGDTLLRMARVTPWLYQKTDFNHASVDAAFSCFRTQSIPLWEMKRSL